MVVVGGGHIVGAVLYRLLGVLHGHTHPGVGDHGAVVQAVAAGHQVLAGQPHAAQKLRQTAVLGHAQRHRLDKEGAGGIQVGTARKLLLSGGAHRVPAGGVQRDKHLAHGVVHIGCQIVHMDHGQLGGKGLLDGPGVRLPLADDALTAVGQDGHILRGGKGAQLRDQRGVQRFFHQRFAGAAVHDLAAVVGQDAAALFVQTQLLGQRLDAGGRPAGRQHDGHALFNGGVQRGAGARGDEFLVVGQGAIQIQRQHFDIRHI